jgi:O-antigen/teichoic acid export membrane protein
METLTSEQFNFIEACFWIFLGLITLCFYFKVDKKFKYLSLFASLVLITFGLSDLAEVYFGSFLVPGMAWLYFWKIIDVIGLIVVLVWYLLLRSRQ